MVGREAPFRPFSGREAPISLNFSNWHPFFDFFNPLFRKKSGRGASIHSASDCSSGRRRSKSPPLGWAPGGHLFISTTRCRRRAALRRLLIRFISAAGRPVCRKTPCHGSQLNEIREQCRMFRPASIFCNSKLLKEFQNFFSYSVESHKNSSQCCKLFKKF
jgi:hypothetical protein